jgi:tellurium resistance protein TerD
MAATAAEVELKSILIGLGWDPGPANAPDPDLNVAAFLLNSSGQVRNGLDFIFYNNPQSLDGTVTHSGDNRTGGGQPGVDDEIITLELSQIPQDISKIVVSVSLHSVGPAPQNFGQARNAFVRLVNQLNNQEIARFDLTDDMGVESAMIFGEIYRQGPAWRFKAIGQGVAGGLRALASSLGVNLTED